MRKKCIALFAALTMVFSLAPVVCAQAAPAPSLPSEHTFYLYDEEACLYIYDQMCIRDSCIYESS